MLVERSPRAKVVPAKVRRNAVQARRVLAFRRARLEDGVVHADVFALGIKLRESALELLGPEGCGNLLQVGRGFRQMLAQRVGQRACAPDKYAGVPVVVSRGDKLFRFFE